VCIPVFLAENMTVKKVPEEMTCSSSEIAAALNMVLVPRSAVLALRSTRASAEGGDDTSTLQRLLRLMKLESTATCAWLRLSW
jgi:hypothetical protein